LISLLSFAALGLVKLSVVLLYRRVFNGNKAFNIYSLVLCITVVLWSLSFTLAIILQCGSRPWEWWQTRESIIEYCDNTAAEYVGACFSDIFIDLLILTAPLPIIAKLHMSFGQKLGLCAVFALGFLSTVAGIMRSVILAIITYDTTFGHRDLLAVDTSIVIWSVVEVGAAIIGSCLPTIRPLFRGNSPESLIGSIRSVFSLQSIGRTSPRHQGYNEDITVGNEIDLHTLTKTGSKPASKSGQNSLENQYTSSFVEEQHHELGDTNV